MSVLVSVITPCFNDGQYLDEAINSIPYDKIDYTVEHIIVNDGSTDLFTLNKLSEIESKGYKIIHQSNSGLGKARNNGINLARGKYIIPLDCDNKLNENYFTKAVDILNKDERVDIVYGNKVLFGNKSGIVKVPHFMIDKMLQGNYIDACAIYKKEIWQQLNGYDENMPVMGNEDWEFWINAFLNKAVFYNLNEICFYYRVTDQSMNTNVTKKHFPEIMEYIYRKHINFFTDFYWANYQKINFLKNNKTKGALYLLLGKTSF